MIFKVKTVPFPNSLNKVKYLCAKHDYGYTENLQKDCVIKWVVKQTIFTLPVSVVLKIFDRFGFTELQGGEFVSHYVIIIPDDYIDKVLSYVVLLPEFQKANGYNDVTSNLTPPCLCDSDKFTIESVVGPIFTKYCENDSVNTKNLNTKEMFDILKIKKVVFNDPATIVYWEDGTKTVVKCSENDTYDPEKGLAMCIAKKAMGNTGRYYDTFKKWKYEEK